MYSFANATSRQLRHSAEMLDAALERHGDAENITGLIIFISYDISVEKVIAYCKIILVD